ncbi:MAG: hypothetical protein ABF486_14400, partial [Lentilactobacillus hilgardii]
SSLSNYWVKIKDTKQLLRASLTGLADLSSTFIISSKRVLRSVSVSSAWSSRVRLPATVSISQ